MQESFETKNLVIKNASSELGIDNLLDELRKINSNKSVIQIFDTNSVINRTHLIAAYVNTITAFKSAVLPFSDTGMKQYCTVPLV